MTDKANRGQIEWVSINNVVPNPLNPRKDDAIRTEEMQEIIKKRGWEEPLTVYKKGKVFIVLAGHRRLYAAREIGVKELPVFITDQPEDHGEELERIASLQSGRVEWTGWEWARFTYERWIAWNKPPITKFAKDISLRPNAVKNYIYVLEYFPRHEIEGGLSRGSYTISGLADMRAWLIKLSKSHTDLYEQLTGDLIRHYMMDKLEARKISNNALRNTNFLDVVSAEQLKEFLTDKNATLDALIEKWGDLNGSAYKSFHGQIARMGTLSKKIKELRPQTPHQQEQALKQLMELQERIKTQINQLQRGQKPPEDRAAKDFFEMK